MPALPTPSIVQQRIIVAVMLVVIGALAWWPNANPGPHRSVQKFSATPLPHAVAELDFTSAEAAWSALRVDSQGNLIIDALTETALLDAIALMRDATSELPMARMALLLEKQFGAVASRQVMALLPELKQYKEVEQRWLAKHAGEDFPPHAELFQLQDELLGKERAKKLFSEQRRLINVMVANRRIRDDTSLTQAQKDQALKDLQHTFQEQGAR